MIKLDSNLPSKPSADYKPQSPPVSESAKKAVKTGTVIVLTPNALQLSRDLQAITSDPAKDPSARFDASEKLRQLAAQIFNER